MPFWRRNDAKPGDRYDGRATWCADPTSGAQRAAFYPVTDEGVNFALPLAWVEDRPDDPDHEGGHYRIIAVEDAPRFEELPAPTVTLQ